MPLIPRTQAVVHAPGCRAGTLLALLLSTVVPTLSAQELVPGGATWRFFRGTQEPTPGPGGEPTADWTLPGFDDSSWELGVSGIGFGSEVEEALLGTVLSDMREAYLTVYLRKTFDVEEAAAVSGLVLEIDYDDGFACFINGVEVARASMFPGPNAYDQVAAANHEVGQPERFEIPATVLVDGENVIAIQGHNVNLGSSDFALVPSLLTTASCPNQAPTAVVEVEGAELIGNVAVVDLVDGVAEVVLDGALSSDGDGGAQSLSFRWSKSSGPDGDVIEAPEASSTRVTVTRRGDYVYTLEVSDGQSCQSMAQASVVLRVPCDNQPPTAAIAVTGAEPEDAGSYRVSLTAGTATVTLDGSNSGDGDGGTQTLSFAWRKLSGPEGDVVVAADAAVTEVSFTSSGVYTYQLTTDDAAACDNTATASVAINVLGPTPSSEALVELGAVWRYFVAREAPPEDWHEPAFDAMAWPSGPTNIGYGDFVHATTLERTGDFLTVYFRHQFEVVDMSMFASLALEVDYDDGFSAYLNGVEIARANLPPRADFLTTATSAHEGGITEFFDVSAALGDLRNGINTLAVEVHNVHQVSSDLSFNLRLAASDSEEPPPPEPSVFFKLADGSASVGSVVEVPFSVRSDRPSSGFSYSINFDEGVLEAIGATPLFERPDGSPYQFQVFEFNNDNATPGEHGLDEGFAVGAAVISLSDTFNVLPAREDVQVLAFEFRVREDAPPVETELRFEDGGIGSGGEVRNSLIAGGQEVTPEHAGSFILVSSIVNIVPDATPFRRGDANSDSNVDLTDAVTLLNFLFVLGDAPTCVDAGDVNDDGVLDISDPMRLLFALTGVSTLPGPELGQCGSDLTDDRLRCAGDTLCE